MHKIWAGLLIISLGTVVLAAEPVVLNSMPKEPYTIPAAPQKVSGSLLINDKGTLEEIIELQKDKDAKDIETLWKGTIENNKVIEFALKKLATPESQRRIHSSLMAKTLSAVVSGASFVPSLIGSNAAMQTSSFSAGRLAQALLNKKNLPQEVPLTDTELIELAGLIEDLQDKIISTYFNYKNALLSIKDTRTRMMLYRRNYEKALQSNDLLEVSISSSLYDNLSIQEYQEEQEAKNITPFYKEWLGRLL